MEKLGPEPIRLRHRGGNQAMKIIINGVGIAGPTLAYWLRKAGHEVLEKVSGLPGRKPDIIVTTGIIGTRFAPALLS